MRGCAGVFGYQRLSDARSRSRNPEGNGADTRPRASGSMAANALHWLISSLHTEPLEQQIGFQYQRFGIALMHDLPGLQNVDTVSDGERAV
jgi:hypothetical protein